MCCSHVLFNIFPAMFDIVVAIVFFSAAFNLWTGLIVLFTMTAYLGRLDNIASMWQCTGCQPLPSYWFHVCT